MDKECKELLQEIADRARRTETRVTKVANHLGVEAGGEKPVCQGGRLYIPSRRVSLEDIIAAIPRNPEGSVSVYCGDDYIVTVAF